MREFSRRLKNTERELWFLLCATLLARLTFLSIVPKLALSVDFRHWLDVGLVLKAGGNPYVETPYLNWPPLWCGILWTLLKVYTWIHIPFFRTIQIFLITTDCLVMTVLYRGLKRLFPTAALGFPLLLGLALNPASILLTCQHGSFDALVALFVLLFAFYLTVYEQGRRHSDWHKACLFLGLGVLSKTVPLILTPLLLPGLLRLDSRRCLSGLILVLGPAALGVGVLYLRNPVEIAENVLAYRSQAGWFGFTGLLGPLTPLYIKLSPALLAGAAALAGRQALTGTGRTGDILLTTALLMIAIPTLGPGYGPQYIGWFIPLLTASYVVDTDSFWRRLLRGLWVIVALTYLYEYGMSIGLGAFLLRMVVNPRLETMSEMISTPFAQTLLRLPIFLAYLTLLTVGSRKLLGAKNRGVKMR